MNSSLTIHVATKVLGRKEKQQEAWRVPLDFSATGTDALTLGDVIAAVVRHEVEEFRQRQTEQRLLRVLTPDAIAQGAERGKILAGARDLDQAMDTPSAVATALQAFEDGLYFAFVDDVQQESLAQLVQLREDSRLLFVRLVALAGG
jgi:hypothetical protein